MDSVMPTCMTCPCKLFCQTCCPRESRSRSWFRVQSSSFFESLGLGLVSQGLGLGRQGLGLSLGRQVLGLFLGLDSQGLGFVKPMTKTMLTCVTFRLQRHQQLTIIFEFFHSVLFGKPRFTMFKHSMQYFGFFSGFVFSRSNSNFKVKTKTK